MDRRACPNLRLMISRVLRSMVLWLASSDFKDVPPAMGDCHPFFWDPIVV